MVILSLIVGINTKTWNPLVFTKQTENQLKFTANTFSYTVFSLNTVKIMVQSVENNIRT